MLNHHHTQYNPLIENYGRDLEKEERRQSIPIEKSAVKESLHSNLYCSKNQISFYAQGKQYSKLLIFSCEVWTLYIKPLFHIANHILYLAQNHHCKVGEIATCESPFKYKQKKLLMR